MEVLRIGTLGAAAITPLALVKPAKRFEGAEVVALAARDRGRADKFAGKHGIPRVHASYDELLADPDVDAIYNPLPNSHHAEWTLKALDAGKHVLCEKPFTANTTEAEIVAKAAENSGLVVMEAFHYRYHPLVDRLLEIINGGELGQIRHVETAMGFPLLKRVDIRWRLDLAGGALMDVGCYTIHQLRTLARAEPEVVAARALLKAPGVDRAMTADFAFPDGVTGRVSCFMLSGQVLRLHARVVGDRGELRVFNMTMPHVYHRISVRSNGARRRERVPDRDPTYLHQLRAFAAAVRDGAPIHTPPSDAIANMRVIDAVYRAAGLEPRTGTTA